MRNQEKWPSIRDTKIMIYFVFHWNVNVLFTNTFKPKISYRGFELFNFLCLELILLIFLEFVYIFSQDKIYMYGGKLIQQGMWPMSWECFIFIMNHGCCCLKAKEHICRMGHSTLLLTLKMYGIMRWLSWSLPLCRYRKLLQYTRRYIFFSEYILNVRF